MQSILPWNVLCRTEGHAETAGNGGAGSQDGNIAAATNVGVGEGAIEGKGG